MCLKVAGKDGPMVAQGVAHQDIAQPLPQFLDRIGQAQNGHDFGGRDDIESVLSRKTIMRATEGNHDVAQGPVVHVNDALPMQAPLVQIKLIALMDMVVDHRRQ